MRGLRTQLSLAFALVALITVSLTSFLSNTVIERKFEAYLESQQSAKAESIAMNLSLQYDSGKGEWDLGAVHALGMYSLSDGYIIKVYDIGGKPLWDAENHDMAQCRIVMESISLRMAEHGALGDFTAQDFPLTLEGREIGRVSVSSFGPYFLDENDFSFINALYFILMAVGTASLLLSFASGFALARRISHPISRSADIAKQIAAGNYDIRFEGETKTKELHNLVSSVNHLAAALARQEKLRSQLTADVAHELRTPLATLGTHIEAMMEGVWEPTPKRLASCHEEILRLGKMVADLERLERAESDSLKLDKEPVDLLALARGVCDNFAGELANKGLRLSIGGEPVVVPADRDRIKGVIGNLMSNAVKYTPEGGCVQVFVGEAGGMGSIAVADDGIGIPEGELPLVFERFYRADKSRNRGTGGAGIGLCVVKSVVAAHGGEVEAWSVLGEGSRFEVRLPKGSLRN